jgi:Kef-type K+ transport system membrane component KefB
MLSGVLRFVLYSELMDTTTLFTDLSLILAVSLIGPALSAIPRLAVPAVIGELAAGAVIGHTGFGAVNVDAGVFPTLYALGFAMLMLQAGTHVDISSPTLRRGLVRGLLAFALVLIASLIGGIALCRALDMNRSLLLGVLIAGSSAAVAFPIIEERRLTGPRIEFLIAWIAVADSTTVILMPLTLTGSSSLAAALGGDIALVACGLAALYLALKLRGGAIVKAARHTSVLRGWGLEVRLSMCLLLGLSAIAVWAGASTLLAGFMAGIVLVRLHESNRLTVQLSGLSNGFFVPLFFVLLGARLDLRSMFGDGRAIALAVGLAAIGTVTHVLASSLVGVSPRRWVSGLAASAQLGLPAAAASLALASHTLSPAYSAALVAAGCLTLIPATVGATLLGQMGQAPTGG